MLTRLCFGIFFHIHRTRLAIYSFEFTIGSKTCLFKLQQHKATGHCNHTDIVPWHSLYSHYITFLQRDIVAVPVITLMSILELYLNYICIFFVSRYTGKPVESVQRCIHLATTSAANTCTTIIFFEFLIHLSVFYPNNHSQRHVEKDHFSINILFYMSLCFGKFLNYPEDIVLIYKRRETYREVTFCL